MAWTFSNTVAFKVNNANVSGAPTTIRTDENAHLIATAYTQSPKKSQRWASAELSISRSSLQRIMKDIGTSNCIGR